MNRIAKLKLLAFLPVTLVLAACVASPVVTFGPDLALPKSNTLFLNMANDPDLLALELQVLLEAEGLEVDLSSGESAMSQTIIDRNTLTTFENVSASQAPYELTVSYKRGGYPYRIIWHAILRDRENNTVIGTYKYDYDAAHQNFGWNIKQIMDDMVSKLIHAYWSYW
ncbi:hypothetical protein [Microbulbifer sp. TYP-18]|uniref:hypothetical protein n=1 Tax=Microbulbifer sp. TYP-18 TaxID=3230024 RepID=UPI0034C67653